MNKQTNTKKFLQLTFNCYSCDGSELRHLFFFAKIPAEQGIPFIRTKFQETGKKSRSTTRFSNCGSNGRHSMNKLVPILRPARYGARAGLIRFVLIKIC